MASVVTSLTDFVMDNMRPAAERLRLQTQHADHLRKAIKAREDRDTAQATLDECLDTAKRIREQLEVL